MIASILEDIATLRSLAEADRVILTDTAAPLLDHGAVVAAGAAFAPEAGGSARVVSNCPQSPT